MAKDDRHSGQYQRERYRPPFLATDLIIEHFNGQKQGIVLITRKNPPYGVALPGGFAEYGLSLEENARKEGMEETGLEFMIENPEAPLCVHSDPDRDPRAHVISATYYGRGVGKLSAGDDAATASIYSIDELKCMLGKKEFAFPDHEKAIVKWMAHKGYMTNEEASKYIRK
ncbi:MAG: NUDIX hydrolase [Candidatus Woesearchaeota archaeon]|nr:NUDIX hydrolase [Candidatus Woesearchaeota archaeon]